VVLGSPESVQEFAPRVLQYDRWMQQLLARDTDVGLYLLFQLATNSPVGYSASHALVCAVLSHLIAAELKLPREERDSLIRASLTMNIAMTALQDHLAGQVERPSPAQMDAIRAHPVKGGMMLANLGVDNELWLDVVSSHHDDRADADDLMSAPARTRLARIVRVVDRYAAMISPRKTRAGRSSTESMRSVMGEPGESVDEVGQALVRTVGLCPPGTYVRLDNGDVAVVMRRSSVPNQPHVAIVLDQSGEPLGQPRLHRTAQSDPQIRSALTASSVRVRLNHHLVLQLGAYAAEGA
jgi:HD-GYP domain-containing protein (c-di-GMP phosphodiesterase class II)